MLAIQIRLLAGRYVATQFDERDKPEWPPHPARLFAAAVAAWADAEEPDPRERAALTWWESLGAPSIACSPAEVVASRSPVTHYVPVNDVRGVLSRDPKDAYDELAQAVDAQAAAAADPDPRLGARARRRAESAEHKAQRKAAGYASGGRAPESAWEAFPDRRMRQGRTFPASTPPDEVVIFSWPDAAVDPEQVAALDGVLGRIGRLGHSSTPVDVAVVSETPGAPAYEPGEPAELALRTAGSGQLDALVAAHEQHHGSDPRTLPSAQTGYRRRRPNRGVAASGFDREHWLVFDIRPRKALSSTLPLTRALRDTLIANADEPRAPIISGHRPSADGEDTAPATTPHAAYLALPYVGTRYADGSIHALAVVLPDAVSSEDRARVVAAIANWMEPTEDTTSPEPPELAGRLVLGRRGAFRLAPLPTHDASVTASVNTWCREATRWSTAIPMALDRHPGALDSPQPEKRERAFSEAEQSVIRACHNIGLPTPAAMAIQSDAPIRGTRPVWAFPPFVVGGTRLRRMLVHVDLTFAEPVRGPVVLGAGRFFGYGLCWPHPREWR